MHDIIIIGAGPAGLTAALYALRADKSVLVLEKETFGGQITFSPNVENYPSVIQMSGNEFAEKLLDQVMHHGADIELAKAEKIIKCDGYHTVITDHGTFDGKAVIIATGSRHRHLGIDRRRERFAYRIPRIDRMVAQEIRVLVVGRRVVVDRHEGVGVVRVRCLRTVVERNEHIGLARHHDIITTSKKRQL